MRGDCGNGVYFFFVFKKTKFVVYRIFLQIDLASSIEGGMRRVKYLNEGITPLIRRGESPQREKHNFASPQKK
jgi:hypothetical protein